MGSEADVLRSVEAWVSQADDLDLIPAAIELDRVREQLGPSEPGDRLRTARLHLLADDLNRAEQVLAMPADPGAVPATAGRLAALYMQRSPDSLKPRPGRSRKKTVQLELFCNCLTSTLVHGPQAADYALKHLRRTAPSGAGPEADLLRGRTFRCPDTQVSWLAFPGGQDPAVLLRGAPPELPVQQESGPTGLYL